MARVGQILFHLHRRVVRAAALVALLAGCHAIELIVDSSGEVYQCELEARTVEVCYEADSAAELARSLGARACQLTDRAWPVITNAIGRGCLYECPAPASGCNAKQGCYCP